MPNASVMWQQTVEKKKTKNEKNLLQLSFYILAFASSFHNKQQIKHV
jgi:hypothetical protein